MVSKKINAFFPQQFKSSPFLYKKAVDNYSFIPYIFLASQKKRLMAA
jgi:hypothetical protein